MLTENDILLEASKVLNDEIVKSFQEQGHSLTGAWEKSIYATSEGSTVDGYALDYGAIVNAGTTADRIPYGGMPTGAKTSNYIQGLFNFWKLRKPGITDKEALSLAFATAKKQQQEGMSTWASRAYSATTERQYFVDEAFIQKDYELSNIVTSGIIDVVNEQTFEDKIIIY